MITSSARRQGRARSLLLTVAIALLLVAIPLSDGIPWQSAKAATSSASQESPGPAPEPEPIKVKRLPLPPRPNADGVCESPTGCITGGQAGGWLPDSRTVTLMANYAGAPAPPDPASIYSGTQIVLIKADGTTFPNGDPWKCITCGVPDESKAGMNSALDYPQPFLDGKRILAGTNIIDCSPHSLASPTCTPEKAHVYPIRWNTTRDGSGTGGDMRELRLHPDQAHIGWSKLEGPFSDADPTDPRKTLQLGQFSYFGRLVFNPNPATGEPQVPRYDIVNVNALNSPSMNGTFIHDDPNDPAKLVYKQAGAIGELRGFTGDGQSALGLCWVESNNVDICATSLATGESRRLTEDPSYIDPVDVSPDDNWTVALETRYKDRFWYIAGLPGVPPINQIMGASAGAAASGYRDGAHRFFQPYLIDRYPERPGYHGQRINACQPPEDESTPGSICDPNWGTQADPRWSPDGAKIVYGQNLAQPPNCQGSTPTDCTASTEPGGHTYRLMVAELVSREPQPVRQIAPVPDKVPWGTPYRPGDPPPVQTHVPGGTYTLEGRHSGYATVTVVENADKTGIASVSATYRDYSDDGVNFINGTENVANTGGTAGPVTFNSDLRLSGARSGARLTSPEGFTVTVLNAFTGEMVYTGDMTTTLDGKMYRPPAPTR